MSQTLDTFTVFFTTQDLKGKMKRSRGAAKNRYKKQALQVLKRKKMYEGQRNNLEAQGFNLEQTSFAIETAQDTKDSVAALKQSTVALKAAFKEINIDEVEDIQDEMDDIMMDQEEIQEVMGRAFGNVEDVDEDELMEELDGLEDELEMEDELGVAGDVPSYLADEMPGAPSGPIAATPATEQLDEFGLPVAPVAMQ